MTSDRSSDEPSCEGLPYPSLFCERRKGNDELGDVCKSEAVLDSTLWRIELVLSER
jgi:hypothetical protein